MYTQVEFVGEADFENHGVQQLEYSIKIINPDKLSDYKSVRVCKWKQCEDLKELRLFLSSKVPPIDNWPNFDDTDMGYIEPGHGLKGKKQWLSTDDDLTAMYEKHVGKRNILLWTYSNIPGRENSKKATKGTNFEQHKKTLDEVDEKYDELRKKHGTNYTLEQFRMWGQLIRLGKHDSMDDPPDKPFWRGRKRKNEFSQPSPRKIAGISPSKKVSVRSELLDQLSKWHTLNQTGVVSDEDYEDLKKNILQDIKQL